MPKNDIPPIPCLPCKLSTIWADLKGRRPSGYERVPGQIAKLCRKAGLRNDLVERVKGHIRKIINSNDGRPHKLPDDAITRFVLELLWWDTYQRPLRMGDHVRFFDLRNHAGKNIIALRFYRRNSKLEEPLHVTRDLESVADALAKLLFEKMSVKVQPGGRARLSAPHEIQPMVIQTYRHGVEVVALQDENCPLEMLVLRPARGQGRIRPGFDSSKLRG